MNEHMNETALSSARPGRGALCGQQLELMCPAHSRHLWIEQVVNGVVGKWEEGRKGNVYPGSLRAYPVLSPPHMLVHFSITTTL